MVADQVGFYMDLDPTFETSLIRIHPGCGSDFQENPDSDPTREK